MIQAAATVNATLQVKLEQMRKLQASVRADEQGEKAGLQAQAGDDAADERASVDSELAACEAELAVLSCSGWRRELVYWYWYFRAE